MRSNRAGATAVLAVPAALAQPRERRVAPLVVATPVRLPAAARAASVVVTAPREIREVPEAAPRELAARATQAAQPPWTAGRATVAARAETEVQLSPVSSFFVTSQAGLQRLSNSPNGFGGDLRFGKADGLTGADEICRQMAEKSMPGSSSKVWRAMLSVNKGPAGSPVNAIDRVGGGPWYDRIGRIVAMTKADLQQTRPRGADPAIIHDLPNEEGVPNMAPDGPTKLNNHHMMTGSDATGILRTGATDTVVVGRLPQLPACPMTAAVLNLADHDFID